MTAAASRVQKTWERSAPTRRADFAAKKGAPAYSRQPPRTPTFPAWGDGWVRRRTVGEGFE